MILTEPTFFYGGRKFPFDVTLSFIKSSNIVETVEEATCVVFDVVTFPFLDTKNGILTDLIKTNKKIILDSTYELLWEPILLKMLEMQNLNNVEYYCIERRPDYAEETISKCIDLGLKIYQSQYFADYQEYFKPLVSDNIIEKKKYVLYTGKTRPERTLLVSLLAQCDLLGYGYVSYFGDDYNEYYKNGKIEHVFDLLQVAENENLKTKVKEGISKLRLPLKIDVEKLSYGTAHSKNFNADYYLASEFAVVCETNYDHDFFITEKTTKSILLNKKFLVYGSLNYVSKLKEYYHRKFNRDISHLTDWCDLSYDSEPNKGKRAELIVEQIKNNVV